MKIMILTGLFPPGNGGIETYSLNLARALAKNNEVLVLTTGKRYPLEKKEPFEVIRIDEMDFRKISQDSIIDLKKRLMDILIKNRIEIIHSQNLICRPTKYAKAIIDSSNKLGVPLIDHCHDARKEYLNPNLINLKIDKFIAVSHFVKRNLVSLGILRKKIEIVPNFVDTDLFDPSKYDINKCKKEFDIPKKKKIILFPSRAIRPSTGLFGDQKNFKTVLKSLEYIKDLFGDKFVLVFPENVGDTSKTSNKSKTLKEFYENLKKCNLRENVYGIKQKIGLDKMPQLYKTADVVCTPSINEAFGLVFIESMSMKIPVIGAKSGAVPEIIKEKINGFLVKPFDYKNLAKKIVVILKDTRYSRQLGKHGRNRVLKLFSKSVSIKRLEKLYLKIIQECKK